MSTGNLFSQQERELEAKEKAERRNKYGWTKERARGYRLGHPWADPDAYPPAAELRLMQPLLWEPPNTFPTRNTAFAAKRRAEMIEAARKELDRDLALYEEIRTGKHTFQKWELDWDDKTEHDAMRETLAQKFNHVRSGSAWLSAMERWYSLAQVLERAEAKPK
jgi:hypothetical protein